MDKRNGLMYVYRIAVGISMLGLLLVGGAEEAYALTLINFDELVEGSQMSNTYASKGILIYTINSDNALLNHFSVDATTRENYWLGASLPNLLTAGYSSGPSAGFGCNFALKINFTDHTPVNSVSILALALVNQNYPTTIQMEGYNNADIKIAEDVLLVNAGYPTVVTKTLQVNADGLYYIILKVRNNACANFDNLIYGATTTPPPTLTPIVSVSSPSGGHFISSDLQNNAALPLQIHVSYPDGTPIAGALIHLSNPNGYLNVISAVTDGFGNLFAPLTLPSSTTEQSDAEGDFTSEVIATVNGKDYSSGLKTLYHYERLYLHKTSMTQTQAEDYSANLLIYYASPISNPSTPCASLLCDIIDFIDILAGIYSQEQSYTPVVGDVLTIQVYKYTTPSMPSVYLYNEFGEQSGNKFGNWNKWTEDFNQIQPIIYPCPNGYICTPNWHPTMSALVVTYASPITVLVTSPSGKRAGFDPNTKAFLFEFKMAISNAGDEPYEVLIPNPEEGQYTFEVTGTGSGTYTMTTHSIDDSGEGSTPTTITGTAIIDKTDTHLSVCYEIT